MGSVSPDGRYISYINWDKGNLAIHDFETGKNRDVTEIRLYLETMERVLPGLEKFIVEPDAGSEPLDLRFFDENVTGTRGGW